jgi:hypothetical protein
VGHAHAMRLHGVLVAIIEVACVCTCIRICVKGQGRLMVSVGANIESGITDILIIKIRYAGSRAHLLRPRSLGA